MKLTTINKKKEISQVFLNKKKIIFSFCVVYYIQNQFNENRFCFIIKKKHGNSPERNRIRRKLREALRAKELEDIHAVSKNIKKKPLCPFPDNFSKSSFQSKVTPHEKQINDINIKKIELNNILKGNFLDFIFICNRNMLDVNYKTLQEEINKLYVISKKNYKKVTK